MQDCESESNILCPLNQRSRGLKGKQRGNQSSLTEFKGGLWKIDFQWRGGGGRERERGIIGILHNLMGGIR